MTPSIMHLQKAIIFRLLPFNKRLDFQQLDQTIGRRTSPQTSPQNTE